MGDIHDRHRENQSACKRRAIFDFVLGYGRTTVKPARDAIAREHDANALVRNVAFQARADEIRKLLGENEALAADVRHIQEMLDERDRQFASLHAEYVAIRRNWVWRLTQMIRNDLKQLAGILGRPREQTNSIHH